MTHTLTQSIVSVCPRCGMDRSSVAYARAIEVHAYRPAYHQLDHAHLVAAYQQEQMKQFRRLMDYDQVLAWGRTTPRAILGCAHRKGEHPLRRYLNDVDPSTTGRPRWDMFPSACDALKRFAHIPHGTRITVFECFHTSPTGVTYTVYCPLPSWTRRIMARLEMLPLGTKITRELFLTMLRAEA